MRYCYCCCVVPTHSGKTRASPLLSTLSNTDLLPTPPLTLGSEGCDGPCCCWVRWRTLLLSLGSTANMLSSTLVFSESEGDRLFQRVTHGMRTFSCIEVEVVALLLWAATTTALAVNFRFRKMSPARLQRRNVELFDSDGAVIAGTSLSLIISFCRIVVLTASRVLAI